MLVFSQNKTNYNIPIPSGTIYRINLAWVNDLDELEKLLKKHSKHEIFLDLPIRRIKQPHNSYNLKEIIPFINNNTNIKYFAISNVKTSNDLDEYLSLLPITVT